MNVTISIPAKCARDLETVARRLPDYDEFLEGGGGDYEAWRAYCEPYGPALAEARRALGIVSPAPKEPWEFDGDLFGAFLESGFTARRAGAVAQANPAGRVAS